MLKDRVVIVTGASSGIGAAAAEAFAAAGAHLALVGRRAALLEQVAERARARGVRVLVQPLDVADDAAVRACATRVHEHFGRLDVLAHVAGMNTPRRNIGTMSMAEWRRVLDVNLSGAFAFVQAVVPIFRARGGGSVVIVGSDSGLIATELAGVAYCASKFGVTALVQSINDEERAHGIRACAVQAGEVDTPILDCRPQPVPPERRALMLRPEDVAAALVYAAGQPPRVNVEQIVILPTLDWPHPGTAEVLAGWGTAN